MTAEEAGKVSERAKKTSKVRLQEREFEVLSELERWGILGLGQLEGLLFWTGNGQRERLGLLFDEWDGSAFDRYCYKRLGRLEEAGYIGQEGRVYRLTRRGKARLEEAGKSRGLPLRRSWSWGVARSYLCANGAGLVLEKVMGLEVKSRHQLACESRGTGLSEVQIQSRIPDLTVEGPRPPLAVLIESFRSRGREEKLLRAGGGRTLLYLTSLDSNHSGVLWRARATGASAVYVGGLSEFQERLGETVLTNLDRRTTTLDALTGRTAARSGG